MKNKSIWKENIKPKKMPTLEGNKTCDILIIGGGIAGLSTAYFLKDTKYNIILIDKDICGMGITANTTGKFTFMQDLIYHKIENNYNKSIALKYLNSQKEAIKIAKNIITKNNISCDLENTSSYIFTNDMKKLTNFKKEQKFFDNNNISYKRLTKIPLAFPSIYAIKVNSGFVFHPLKYINSLKDIVKDKIKIYENTKAYDLDKINDYYVIKANDYHIKAKIVIVTTHYPFFVKPYFLPFKSTIEKSHIVIGPYKNKKFQAISCDNPTYSLRFYQNNVMYASNSYDIQNHVDIERRYKESIKDFKKYVTKDIKYYFLNQDIITYDNMPYIGKIKDNLYIATGFNKWGMTNGTISGKVISDLILNKDNPYIDIFNPNRKLSKDKIKNLVFYNYLNSKSFIIMKLKHNFNFYKDNVKVIKKDGKTLGIYTDKKGKNYIVNNICPHLKCNLIFNSVDKTWDCPCHGSRFDIEGNVILGPSVFDIKYKD